MSTHNTDETNNTLSLAEIKSTDTISQFMEKCNNNFHQIVLHNGGPAGVEGEKGEQGVPTRPKVPIHIWTEGEEFTYEDTPSNKNPELHGWKEEELSKGKYQEGQYTKQVRLL